MTWFTGIATYFVVWWLVLFTVLPFGIQRHRDRAPGLEPGAPDKPRIWIKAAVTTVIATLVWLALYAVIESGLIEVRPL